MCVWCVYDLVMASLRDEDVGATSPLGEVIDVLLKGGPIRKDKFTLFETKKNCFKSSVHCGLLSTTYWRTDA